jgi:hypothetical protein
LHLLGHGLNKFNYKKATNDDSFSDNGSNDGTDRVAFDSNPVASSKPLTKLSSHISVSNVKEFGADADDVEMQLDDSTLETAAMDDAFGIGADSDDQQVVNPGIKTSRKKQGKKKPKTAASDPAPKQTSANTSEDEVNEMLGV